MERPFGKRQVAHHHSHVQRR